MIKMEVRRFDEISQVWGYDVQRSKTYHFKWRYLYWMYILYRLYISREV